jgi:hypothetical protein
MCPCNKPHGPTVFVFHDTCALAENCSEMALQSHVCPVEHCGKPCKLSNMKAIDFCRADSPLPGSPLPMHDDDIVDIVNDIAPRCSACMRCGAELVLDDPLSLKYHLAETCPETHCGACKAYVDACDKPEHEANACPEGVVVNGCPHGCRVLRKELDTHSEACPEVRIKCNMAHDGCFCEEFVPRRQLEEHRRTTCRLSLRKVCKYRECHELLNETNFLNHVSNCIHATDPCNYAPYCRWTGSANGKKAHEEQCVRFHLWLLSSPIPVRGHAQQAAKADKPLILMGHAPCAQVASKGLIFTAATNLRYTTGVATSMRFHCEIRDVPPNDIICLDGTEVRYSMQTADGAKDCSFMLLPSTVSLPRRDTLPLDASGNPVSVVTFYGQDIPLTNGDLPLRITCVEFAAKVIKDGMKLEIPDGTVPPTPKIADAATDPMELVAIEAPVSQLLQPVTPPTLPRGTNIAIVTETPLKRKHVQFTEDTRPGSPDTPSVMEGSKRLKELQALASAAVKTAHVPVARKTLPCCSKCGFVPTRCKCEHMYSSSEEEEDSEDEQASSRESSPEKVVVVQPKTRCELCATAHKGCVFSGNNDRCDRCIANKFVCSANRSLGKRRASSVEPERVSKVARTPKTEDKKPVASSSKKKAAKKPATRLVPPFTDKQINQMYDRDPPPHPHPFEVGVMHGVMRQMGWSYPKGSLEMKRLFEAWAHKKTCTCKECLLRIRGRVEHTTGCWACGNAALFEN